MVELIGLHRFNEGHFIGMLRKLGQAIGNPGSGIAVLLDGINRSQHLWGALNEGKAFAFEVALGAVLAVVILENGFVIEKLELRRSTDHVKIDDSFDFGIGERRLRGQGGGWIIVDHQGAGGRGVLRELVGKPHSPSPVVQSRRKWRRVVF